MKLIVLGFFLAFSISTQAAEVDPYAHLHGKSLYKELTAAFETASLPAASELNGWYAGRCVSSLGQNREHGFVLTFNMDGPSLYMGTVYIKGEHNPTAYDHLDADEEASIEAYVANGQKKDIHASTLENGSVVSIGQDSFWRDFGTSYVRKTTEGFVERIHFEVSADRMCYFTRRVK